MSSSLVLAAAVDPRFHKLFYQSLSKINFREFYYRKPVMLIVLFLLMIGVLFLLMIGVSHQQKKTKCIRLIAWGRLRYWGRMMKLSVHLKKSKFIFRNALSSKNASHFPHLAVLAQKYLGIPATFTPSEG